MGMSFDETREQHIVVKAVVNFFYPPLIDIIAITDSNYSIALDCYCSRSRGGRIHGDNFLGSIYLYRLLSHRRPQFVTVTKRVTYLLCSD